MTTEQVEFLLPDDISICILGKLDDVRDVVRCGYVCKRWKDLMSDQQFEESHPELMIMPSNLPMIVFQASAKTYFIDKWWNWKPGGAGGSETETLCDGIISSEFGQQYSINGFILTEFETCRHVVSNPLTGEQVQIFINIISSHNKDFYKANVFGIYLDPIRKEYCTLWRCLVASGTQNYNYRTQYKLLNLGSSGSDHCWRKIGHLWSHRDYYHNTSVICLDGFIYWMVRDSRDKVFMMAFDIEAEDLSQIPLPAAGNINMNFSGTTLVNADGSLSLVEVVHDMVMTVKIWTFLKDGRLWTAPKYIIYQVQPASFKFYAFRAIAMVNRELVLLAHVVNSNQPYVCNLQSGTLRKLGRRDGYPGDVKFWTHHPSIASLKNCGTSILQPVIHIYI